MKCKVCGAESGKYPLCRSCNLKKEKGEVIKCEKCGSWHYKERPCQPVVNNDNNDKFLYEVKNRLISKSEESFYNVIKANIPEGYIVFPQINLATFIDRKDDARFHNELFRNVDFLVTNAEYVPKFIVEINDMTHYNDERKNRDEKVQKICQEAGIPILKLWTSYGANPEYIKKRIDETLQSLPVARVHHFSETQTVKENSATTKTQSNGCYIATCVYGSYDCPQVWMLRRYRDNILAKTFWGRIFVKGYYTVSPILVKWFGKTKWFKNLWAKILNVIVLNLQIKGFESTPYNDKDW